MLLVLKTSRCLGTNPMQNCTRKMQNESQKVVKMSIFSILDYEIVLISFFKSLGSAVLDSVISV